MQFLPPHIEAELERMKRLGSDTQKYEVKAAGKALPENLAETISAFANRGGGTILLGLDERHHFEPATGVSRFLCPGWSSRGQPITAALRV